MDMDSFGFNNLGIRLKSRLLRAIKNHCKASKMHSFGDMRPGRGKGKVRKTDGGYVI